MATQSTNIEPDRPAVPSDEALSRTGAASALIGLIIYFASVLLHPGTAPHETRPAFAHYAEERYWGVIHLLELIGILLMCATGLALAWRLRRGVAGVWALFAGAAMIVFAGVYAIFAAVDGVALGILVRRLAAAAPADQAAFFESAFAVRQIEAGLFALQWFVFGIAAGLFAVAFFRSALPWRSRAGLGGLSVLACVGAMSFGVVQAQTGFTETSMAFQAGLYAGILWVAAVGLFLFRSPAPQPLSTTSSFTRTSPSSPSVPLNPS